eukprot:TRINITY_DN37068_c0_g1_i1.p1 TRINITY_DN37068_c0_g1~~TRINITY_DN37068_c0_g1_i1.p1  ORF type:complete len:200 (+),score=60.50 TRINITY_DN37068_c0_g1_i1:44-601(+)
MPCYVVLLCAGCGHCQVQQEKKRGARWVCGLCGAKQSVQKVIGRSVRPAELRPVAQRVNAERGRKECAVGRALAEAAAGAAVAAADDDDYDAAAADDDWDAAAEDGWDAAAADDGVPSPPAPTAGFVSAASVPPRPASLHTRRPPPADAGDDSDGWGSWGDSPPSKRARLSHAPRRRGADRVDAP